MKSYLVLFKEIVVQEDTYWIKVNAESEEEAITKAYSEGNRVKISTNVLNSLSRTLIDVQEDA